MYDPSGVYQQFVSPAGGVAPALPGIPGLQQGNVPGMGVVPQGTSYMHPGPPTPQDFGQPNTQPNVHGYDPTDVAGAGQVAGDNLLKTISALKAQQGLLGQRAQELMTGIASDTSDYNALPQEAHFRLLREQALQKLQQRIATARMSPLPPYEPPELEQPDDLELPATPQYHRGTVEPVSAMAAGILGLVSPRNAGEFGAAALHGAILRNQQDLQMAQEQFNTEFKKRIAQNQADLQGVEAQNKQIMLDAQYKYDKTQQQHALEMQKAESDAQSDYWNQDEKKITGDELAAQQNAGRLSAAIGAKNSELGANRATFNMLQAEITRLNMKSDTMPLTAAEAASRDALLKETAAMREDMQADRQANRENNTYKMVQPGGQLLRTVPGQPPQVLYTNPNRPTPLTQGQGIATYDQQGNPTVSIPPTQRLAPQPDWDTLHQQNVNRLQKGVDDAQKAVSKATGDLANFMARHPRDERDENSDHGQGMRATWTLYNTNVLTAQQNLAAANAALQAKQGETRPGSGGPGLPSGTGAGLPPGNGGLQTLTPQQARSVPRGTRFRGTNGKIYVR